LTSFYFSNLQVFAATYFQLNERAIHLLPTIAMVMSRNIFLPVSNLLPFIPQSSVGVQIPMVR
ncbi:MAG: hypothetical protein MJK14_23760, partial [Rivularia sp. ALOHA_DT_140]|nr:hypothetical protein [Rivularia sp. ALOHA_DT_140]